MFRTSLKWMSLVLVALSAAAATAATASAPLDEASRCSKNDPRCPELVPYLPERTFVPKGFDDNDNSQIVVSGTFPNTCYRMGSEQVFVDHERHEVRVMDIAYHYAAAVCLQVMVPYTKVINLGLLSAGNYRVIFEGAEGTTQDYESIPVQRAVSVEPDEFLYANVDDAFVEWDSSGAAYIVIRGDISSTCGYLKEVRVLREPGDVLAVLPIAGMDPGPDCMETSETFERRVPLVDPPATRTLLHVRSLNGRSINKVIAFGARRMAE